MTTLSFDSLLSPLLFLQPDNIDNANIIAVEVAREYGRQLHVTNAQHLNPLSSNSLKVEFYICGVICLFITILLYHCLYEHQMRERYPQNVISLLLALGMTFRTIWWFGSPAYPDLPGFWVLNRFAILCQFSSMTYLLLMWVRSMIIFVDTITESKLIKQSSVTDMYKQHNQIAALRQQSTEVKAATTKYYRFTFIVNVFFWAALIATVPFMIQNNKLGYIIFDLNILAIATSSLLIAVCFYVISIRLTLKVYRNVCGTPEEQIESPNCAEKIIECFKSVPTTWRIVNFDENDPLIDAQDKNQRRVLRSIMRVSLALTTLFFIRCICFMYRPVFLSGGADENYVLSYIIYPSFFYLFPEVLPALIIGTTIAPPQGFIRRLNDMCGKIFCNICCKKANQRSEFSLELPDSTTNKYSSNGKTSAAYVTESRSSSTVMGGSQFNRETESDPESAAANYPTNADTHVNPMLSGASLEQENIMGAFDEEFLRTSVRK